MAISTVVTRGFGNGNYSGTITLSVLRGYTPGAEVFATTITVPLITDGADLTDLAYVVFSSYDVSTAAIAVQGTGETTDSATELVVDITGAAISIGDVCVILITDVSGAPTSTNRAAVCYGTAA